MIKTDDLFQCSACLTPNPIMEKIGGYVKGEYYGVCRCCNCHSVYAVPPKNDQHLYNAIYSQESSIPGYVRYKEYENDVKSTHTPALFLKWSEPAYFGLISTIQKSIPKGGKILEIGSGLGYTTYALRKLGYDSYGVDISKQAVEKACKNFGNHYICGDFFSPSVIEDRYDAVFMTELIEHVSDPLKFINQAKSLLKDGGIVILTTTNMDWYPKNTIWSGDLPPVHLHLMTHKGMEELAKRANMKAGFFNYSFYNIVSGQISKPLVPPSLNSYFLTEDYKSVFHPFRHSKLYHLLKRLELYSAFNMARTSVKGYFGAIAGIIRKNRKLDINTTHTMCAILRPKDHE